MSEQSRLAQGLGWFSIALGAAEVLAPRSTARTIGLPDNDETVSLLRTLGAREIGNGLALLVDPDRGRWSWARVGGDAIDLSVLASAYERPGADPRRLNVAIASVLGVAALDLLAATQTSGTASRGNAATTRRARRTSGVRVERAITVNRPVDEVYTFWRNFENFPRFMRHLESVQILDEKRSRWRATAPAGMSVEWVAEIVVERGNEWIGWKSVEGADVENSGSVRFTPAPGGRGTEVRVQLQYAPPAGRLGRALAWMFGEEPEQQIKEDLRRFKQLMETGEIPISEGPGLWRPAQPPADPRELDELAGVRA